MEVEDDVRTSLTARIREYPEPSNTVCADLGRSRIKGLMKLVDEVIKGFTVPEVSDGSLSCLVTEPVELAHCHAGCALSPGGASDEQNAECKGTEPMSE